MLCTKALLVGARREQDAARAVLSNERRQQPIGIAGTMRQKLEDAGGFVRGGPMKRFSLLHPAVESPPGGILERNFPQSQIDQIRRPGGSTGDSMVFAIDRENAERSEGRLSCQQNRS